ncbi:MAG: Ig-like domain-containing protein, partial [Bacteroidota bacterium]
TGAISQVISVEPSATYILSGATKIVSGTRGDLAVQTWPDKQWLKTIVINTTEWTEKSTTFTVPEGVDQVNVYVYLPGGNSALADNIQLIKRVPATGIQCASSEIVLEVEETSQIVVNFSPQDANNQAVSYASLDNSVATVGANGTVKGIALGTAGIVVVAEDGEFSDTCQVIVTLPNVITNSGFETGDISGYGNWNAIAVQSEDVYAGNYSALVAGPASVGQQFYNLKPNTTYEFSAYAKVTEEGMKSFVGVKDYGGPDFGAEVTSTEFERKAVTFSTDEAGTAQVYLFSPAGSNAIGDDFRLVPLTVSVTSVEVNPADFYLHKGDTATAAATVLPTNATVQDVVLHSVDSTIASVDDNGLITALQRGTTQIVATSVSDAAITDTSTVAVWYQSPYAALSVPGIIELEDYDEGGESIAYHDATPNNVGGAYRQDDVDIEPTSDQSGSYNLTDISVGEWAEYEIHVTDGDNYYFFLRALAATESMVQLEFESLGISEVVTISASGSWQTASLYSALELPQGNHILRITSLSDDLKLNFLEVAPASAECVAAPAWQADKVYAQAGIEVMFEGKRYESQFYTKGDTPSESDAWQMIAFCSAPPLDCYNTLPWVATTTYPETGTQVVHKRYIYTSQWHASPGQEPGVDDVWKLEGTCTASSLETPPTSCPDVAPWVAFAEYSEAGIEVTHNGVLYTNQWHASAGQEPGVADVWRPIAPCTPIYEMPACPEVASWNEQQVYATVGTEVLYQNSIFTNQYYASAGQTPGVASVWEYQYTCSANNN